MFVEEIWDSLSGTDSLHLIIRKICQIPMKHFMKGFSCKFSSYASFKPWLLVSLSGNILIQEKNVTIYMKYLCFRGEIEKTICFVILFDPKFKFGRKPHGVSEIFL